MVYLMEQHVQGNCQITTNYGISTVTQTATGEYTVNWDQPFSNDEYIVTCNSNPASYGGAYCGLNNNNNNAITSSYARVEIRDVDASERDSNLVTVFAFKLE